MGVAILAACCAGLAYLSFRRNGDALLAVILGILVFLAFLAGSLLRPVELTAKRTSIESTLAERVSTVNHPLPPLDQQSLDNLPNIPVPASGQIDFIGVRAGQHVRPSHAPDLRAGEQVELRGQASDPLTHGPASGLFVIINSRHRVNVSSGYGLQTRGTTFVVDVPASSLSQGTNQLELGAIAGDERGFFKLPDRVTVTVAER